MQNLAEALKEGAKELIENTIGWWLKVDSINLASSPAQEIRGWTLYIAFALATGGAMWALIRVAFRRRAEPLWDATGGLLRVAAVFGMTGAGFIMPQLLMNAVDSFAEHILDQSVNDRIVELTAMAGIQSPGMVIFLSILLITVGAVQAVLMFLREGAIIVLSGLLVLAAAGGMTHVTRGWWSKLTGVLLALIFYKAAAALVWGTALAFLDTRGSENPVRSFFVGVTMFVLSIFALGPMTKFFSWSAAASVGGG
ncbi:MAG TPA: hypothetical protein VM754_10045, partial [Actinomycetota bacterium]|nr:hypothetical protein [Actinomycetota bacterium]